MMHRRFCYFKALVPSTCHSEYNSSSEYGVAPQKNAMSPVGQELPSWTFEKMKEIKEGEREYSGNRRL
eukprot:6774450-Alexandrium_andersonii.AAC.1